MLVKPQGIECLLETKYVIIKENDDKSYVYGEPMNILPFAYINNSRVSVLGTYSDKKIISQIKKKYTKSIVGGGILELPEDKK